MKHLELYEGFIDKIGGFFKKTPMEEDTTCFLDVFERLYDIMDDHRMECSLNGSPEGIFYSDDDMIGENRKLTFLVKNNGNIIRVYDNKFTFRLIKNEDYLISDTELKEILLDIESTLKSYKCKMTFYLSYGYDEGRSIGKFKTVESTFKNIIGNISIKIESEKSFNTNGMERVDACSQGFVSNKYSCYKIN